MAALRCELAAWQVWVLGAQSISGDAQGLEGGAVVPRAWRTARQKVLTLEEYASPLGRRVYGLRHTCLTSWLNEGVPPAQVVEWAGNSVPVLLAIYARCVSGHLRDLKMRIEPGGDLPELSAGG